VPLGTIRCVTRESKAAEIVANGSSSRACAESAAIVAAPTFCVFARRVFFSLGRFVTVAEGPRV